MNNNTDQSQGSPDFAHSYSLYKYFKRNPAVLGVIISAITAASSFLFDFILSISTNRYLSFWKMDIYSIKPPANSLKTYLIFALAIQFVVAYITLQITPLLYSSAYCKAVLFRERKKLYRIVKTIRRLEREHAEAKKRVTDPDSIRGLEKNIELLLSEKQEAKEIDISISRKLLWLRLRFLGQCCLIYILLFIISLYIFSIGSPATNSPIALFLFPLGILITNIILGYVANPSIWNKNIKSGLNNSEFINSLKTNSEGSIKKVLSLGLKSQLSNEKILGLFRRIVLTVLVFATGFLIPAVYFPSQKTDFPIIQVENKTYAIIISDDQYLYTEEALINEKTISIYVNKHRLIEKSAKDIQLFHFETVNALSEP